jgi:hypothetical protein
MKLSQKSRKYLVCRRIGRPFQNLQSSGALVSLCIPHDLIFHSEYRDCNRLHGVTSWKAVLFIHWFPPILTVWSGKLIEAIEAFISGVSQNQIWVRV